MTPRLHYSVLTNVGGGDIKFDLLTGDSDYRGSDNQGSTVDVNKKVSK